MHFVIWILAGALLGWSITALVGIRDRRGMTLNVVVGMAGVMLGGWLLGGLMGTSAFRSDDWGLAAMLVSLMGATVFLALANLLRDIAGRKLAQR